MTKENKKMKLDFDLDDTGVPPEIVAIAAEEIPTLEETKTSISDEQKWEAYTLPIKVTDNDGNFKYQMKLLDNITVDEFKTWMREVLPLGEEMIHRFMGLENKNEKNTFHNLKVRREMFNAVVKMHEMRWVFGLGKDRLPKDLGSN